MKTILNKYHFLKLTLAMILSASVVIACSPGQSPGNPRLYDVAPLTRQQAEASTFSIDRVWPEPPTTSACERLETLANERSHRRSRFSFLAAPFSYSVANDGAVRAIGSVNLMNSPLIQFVLTQPAVERRVREVLAMDDTAFLNLARERLDVEACEREEPKTNRCLDNLNQWRGALGKQQEGLLYQERPNAIARELRAKFAGVFGNADDMRLGKNDSVFLNVLNRVGLFAPGAGSLNPIDAEAILSAEVPLFPFTRTWSDWLEDTKASVPAAIHGLSQETDRAERLCALVLWQRMFAQLLLIKGYESPVLTSEGHLPTLSTDATQIPKFNVPGAYFDRNTAGRLMLRPEEIPLYDPTLENAVQLQVVNQTPLPRDRSPAVAAPLRDALDQFETYIWVFSATSPAASWAQNGNYFFGDLVESDHAIAPFQTHSLALGLAMITLRNLGVNNLLPVDFENDRVLSASNGTALALLANGKTNLEAGEQNLYDLARFTLGLVRLDDSLKRVVALGAQDQDLLERRSMVFDKETGQDGPFYSREKLHDFENLFAVINRLKYPLANRMKQMAENPQGCVGKEVANYQIGGNATRQISAPCSEEDLAIYREAMTALANNTRSTVFLRRAGL